MRVEDKINELLTRLQHKPKLIDWISLLDLYQDHKHDLDSNMVLQIKKTNEQCRLYWNQDRIIEVNGFKRIYKGLNIKPNDITPRID